MLATGSRTVKQEELSNELSTALPFQDRAEAEAEVFQFIERWYNAQ